MTKKKVSLEPRFCAVCGVSIDDLIFSAKVCKNPECKKSHNNMRARESYSKNLKEKQCTKCKALFLATAKQKCCEQCRDSRKDNKFIQVEKEIKCKHCGKLIETVIKNKTKTTNESFSGVCDECRQKTLEETSERMKLYNPSYEHSLTKEEYEIKIKEKQEYNSDENKLLRKLEFIKRTKERMTTNNPMFNPETVKKMTTTIKSKIKSGELVYKKGIEHPLYKGNRNFNKQVRIELRD